MSANSCWLVAADGAGCIMGVETVAWRHSVALEGDRLYHSLG